MASPSSSPFQEWLCGVLEDGGVDGEVYGGYISGSLAAIGGSSREEVQETLEETLSGCLDGETEIGALCTKILDEWMLRETDREVAKAQEEEEKTKKLTVDLPVASGVREGSGGRRVEKSMMEGLSATEKRRLVAQYGDLSNDEDDDTDDIEDDPGGGGAMGSNSVPTMTDVFKNMNAQVVARKEREKKEKAKMTHEAKVERDRKNKETQKQKVLDGKEKEKKRTQKQERRR